jgi:L-fucose isomerase-like protein
VPNDKMMQMARLGVVLDDFVSANELHATRSSAGQASSRNWGCNVCTCMSMMCEALMPSACEVDVTGRAVDARAVAGVTIAERPRRLEQQLRRR